MPLGSHLEAVVALFWDRRAVLEVAEAANVRIPFHGLPAEALGKVPTADAWGASPELDAHRAAELVTEGDLLAGAESLLPADDEHEVLIPQSLDGLESAIALALTKADPAQLRSDTPAQRAIRELRALDSNEL